MGINIIFFLIRLYFRVFNSIKISGLEKIPAHGPLIIVANHVSVSDPPALAAYAALVRKISMLAKKELFAVPPFGAMFRSWGAIPVDRRRGGGDLGAFRAGLKVLRGGGCLILFPEGTRAQPGRPLKPKPGAAMFAAKSGAPVLCARTFNTENFLKLSKITIKFGNMRYFGNAAQAARPPDHPPAALSVSGGQSGGGVTPRESYEEFSNLLMSDIFSITEE
ncbi:MAG: hypothetical protein A2X34_04730 [Elusimicrobia bacterium GWC2_51_8]|nr:MAG: hypothetical protein A2X34_04730 [Elusimicrobia bacterium GWC2_51_8]